MGKLTDINGSMPEPWEPGGKDIWFQVSRSGRMVARFPTVDHAPVIPSQCPWWDGTHYLTSSQVPTEHTRTLSQEEFKQFRDNGGTTYTAWWFNHYNAVKLDFALNLPEDIRKALMVVYHLAWRHPTKDPVCVAAREVIHNIERDFDPDIFKSYARLLEGQKP